MSSFQWFRFPSYIVKRFYRFIIKRIIGDFLSDDIGLGDIDVGITTGKLHLKKLSLNTEYINASLHDIPLICIHGWIDSVEAHIPYRNLMQENCKININGITLKFLPSNQVQVQHSTSHASIIQASIAELKRD